jgi:PAS domain S-box-containing protein
MNTGNHTVQRFPARLTFGQNVLRVALVALAYFVAHQIAFLFPDAEQVLMAVWPAGGIGLASLLLSPRRLWPWILVGIFLAGNSANLLAGRPLVNSVGFMTANVLESLACAWLITAWSGESVRFSRVREVVALICAATVVNACTSLIGAGTAALAGVSPFWIFWRTWWIADGLGILVVAPLIVAWSTFPDLSLRGRWTRALESGLFMALWCGAVWLTFHAPTTHDLFSPQPYILIALLGWAALRLGQRGVTVAIAVLAVIAVTSSAVRIGPLLWGGDSLTDRLLLAQMFLACTAATGFLLAASYAESKSAEQSAREDQARIRAIGDNLPNGMVYQIVRERDGSKRFQYLSAGVEKLNGVSVEEVLRDPSAFYRLFTEEDRPEVAAAEDVSARDMSPINVVARILRPDGQLRWMHLSSSPRLLADGRIMWDGIQMDITDRKRAEEALRASEEKYRAVFDNAGIGIDLLDRDGRILQVNQSLLDMLGYSEEDLHQLTFLDITFPEEREISKRNLEALMAGEIESYRLEKRYLRKDRSILWADLTTSAIRGPNGEHSGTIGVILDITDRKLAKEALAASEEWYRSLVDRSFDGIFVQQGPKIVYANARLYEMLGYSEGELEGIDHWLIYHPDYQEITRERAKARMRGEEVASIYEVKLMRKDGSSLDGEISAIGVTVKGEPGIQVWVRDVSKRKRLEEVQRRLARAIEQCAEAIVITDLRGNVEYVNPAHERITGYTREEVLGSLPPLFKEHELKPELRRKLSNSTAGGADWSGRMTGRRKDGTLSEIDVTISAVRDPDGRIVNLVGVERDVTEEVQLQRQLLQAQKMESIGTLAGGIAHDFNNLLQVTLGFSELLLAEKREDDPEYADLSKILQSARSGAELVQRLLTFSRKVEPKPIPLNLNRRILQVEKLLRRTIPKMIDIQMDLSDDLADINADPTQMEQVLMNLAVNARDAMPDRGTLAVRTKNVTLDDEYCRVHAGAKPGEYVLLTVSDTGHGMDKVTIDHVFEPFYTTKELGRGTGLGLAMVYGIVKQHGGYISCYSEVENGTTFNVYLPSIESQVEPEVDTTGVMPAFGTETILLVDDEEFVRDLGVRILSRAGYNVLTATNGKEALDLFEKERTQISLVILDLIMPEMGGKECLKELRKIDPQLKVLIASGLSADPSTKESVEMGTRGFVSKPFRMKELLQQVRKVLDSD